jgi:hypothetical protein
LNSDQSAMLASIAPYGHPSSAAAAATPVAVAPMGRHRTTGYHGQVLAAEQRMDAAIAVLDARIADVHNYYHAPLGSPSLSPSPPPPSLTPVLSSLPVTSPAQPVSPNISLSIEEKLRRAGMGGGSTAWGAPPPIPVVASSSSPPNVTVPTASPSGSGVVSHLSWSGGRPTVGYVSSSSIEEKLRNASVRVPPTPPGPYKASSTIEERLKPVAAEKKEAQLVLDTH